MERKVQVELWGWTHFEIHRGDGRAPVASGGGKCIGRIGRGAHNGAEGAPGGPQGAHQKVVKEAAKRQDWGGVVRGRHLLPQGKDKCVRIPPDPKY